MVGNGSSRNVGKPTMKGLLKSRLDGLPWNQARFKTLFDAGRSDDSPPYRTRLRLFLKGGAPDLYANGACHKTLNGGPPVVGGRRLPGKDAARFVKNPESSVTRADASSPMVGT
jgi:hypothetical protein